MEPISITDNPIFRLVNFFDVIFLEQFCDELGIGIESGAAILAGQPWLKTRTKPGEAIKGTSVVSKYGRMLLRNAKTPFGIRVPTPVGVRMRKTNSLAAVIARYVPWLGWIGLVNSIYQVSRKTQEKYNLIARPKTVYNGHPFNEKHSRSGFRLV